ncbi:MAG: helix-turn-helix transcriptional regulator [Anaerolineaceae bacterium]|nr:helix-turn-helix transcriptional regulator [Anaerolineaceae bacterium]
MSASAPYEKMIGLRIKQFREDQGLSMRELGRRTELSVSFLSQVERGLVSISISSLRKIAHALDISILYFLDDQQDKDLIMRAESRQRIVPPGYSDYIEVLAPNLGNKAEVFLAHMSPGGEYIAQSLKAQTDECLYMVKGALKIELDGKNYQINGGDSICFKGSSLNRFCCVSTEEALWLWVVTPPEF